METYRTPYLQEQYSFSSSYSPLAPYGRLVSWPESYAPLSAETPLLAEALQKLDYDSLSLPEQVFGRQIRFSQLSAKRLTALLYERCALHYRHMADLRSRHLQFQGYLFGASLQASLDNGRRLSNLEKVLLQLDSDMRREELAFWKDSTELRNALFDKTEEYATTRDRASLLGPLGGAYGLE